MVEIFTSIAIVVLAVGGVVALYDLLRNAGAQQALEASERPPDRRD